MEDGTYTYLDSMSRLIPDPVRHHSAFRHANWRESVKVEFPTSFPLSSSYESSVAYGWTELLLG